MPYSTLPAGSEAAKLWEEIYNKALKQYKDDKEKAARTAWSALKGAGYHKDDSGTWVKGKSEFAQFSMQIIKASYDKEANLMRWRSVNSDTDPDLYEESMSTVLFKDFVDRIENNTPVPEPFKSVVCEDTWCGGMPYLSIAHYKSGSDAKNVPGEVESVYVDGKMLKSTGVCSDTPLGIAVFKALNKDLYTKKSDGSPEVSPDERIRISIGFLDLQHKHLLDDGTEKVFDRTDLGQICQLCSTGIGRKIYTKGQLVHLALTRVPVNPRTLMEVDKAMTKIITKKDDAESIVGKDLVEKLEEKSLADDVIVIKSDGSTQPSPMDIPDNMDKCYDPNTDSYDQDCVDNLMMGEMPPLRNQMMKNKDVEKATTESLSERVNNINSAFSAEYNDSNKGYYLYPEQIYEDYVVVNCEGVYYKVPYTETDEGFDFPPRPSWIEVKKNVSYDEKSTVEKAVTKSESWGDEPASSYLVVGDPKHPTTWHLPVKKKGKLDTDLMGAAKAALTSNHRGKAYGGPSKGKALSKLRSLYKSHGMDFEEKKSITEESMAKTKRKQGEIEVEDVDRFDDEDVTENDATNEEMNQKKAKSSKKPPKDEEETETDDNAQEEKDEEKKSLTSVSARVNAKVLELRSKGIVGKEAEKELQPLLNQYAQSIDQTLSPEKSAAGGVSLADMRSLMEEMLTPVVNEVAVLKARFESNPTGGPKQAFTPQPRSLRLNQKAQTDKPVKQLSQIERIARKSAGLDVD